jgi:lycopene elongase/hydratase (dihydrobisanhydrobacterioruberin-forming)
MSAVAPPRRRGVVLPYLLHLRPAEWPVMAAHTALGWFLATGLRAPSGNAWLGIASWVVLLNGGTLALNSAFDRDEGDIAFLRNPPQPPRYLAIFAALLMAAGLALTWRLPGTYRALYVVCVVMSIAYSVPPIRLKSVAGMDWVINMIGFGTLTPYAAWAITGRPLDGPFAPVLWSFTPLFAALYPLTQLYQMDEDRARGDRTLALRLGARGSLTVAVFCAALAFGMLAMAGWRSGWYDYELKRWGALAIAATAWVAVLVPWYRNARIWSTHEHQRAMYHALAAWALTDIAVLLAWAA